MRWSRTPIDVVVKTPSPTQTGWAGRLLTVDAAAARLGVPRKRIYEMLSDGRLERVQLGERTLRTTERSVVELINRARDMTA